jgi:CMP-N-acetylneuraminic acid synthetase
VQPTSPIRSYIDFDNAINLTNKNKFDSLFTSLKIKDYFVWKENKKKLEANYNYKKRPRRQVIISKYLENGSFYIFNTKKFLKEKCRLFGKIGTYSQNKIKSFQIDDKEDLKIINKLM